MKNVNKLCAALLALSLFSAAPAMTAPVAAEQNAGLEDSDTVKIADLDQKYVDVAEKALVEYGNGQTYTLEEAFKNPYYDAGAKKQKDCWIIQSKSRDVIVSVDVESAKLLTVSLKYDISAMTEANDKFLQTARKAVQQLSGNAKAQFEDVYFFKSESPSNKKQVYTFSLTDRQFIEVDAIKNQPTNFSVKLPPSATDKKLLAKAEQAVKKMPKAKFQPFTDVVRSKFEETEILVFSTKKIVQSVTIGAKTGKLYAVNLASTVTDKEKKSLTKQQATAIVKPLAKSLFGIELAKHTLTIDKDWGDYKFSSKGKEGLIAKFDNAGTLFSLESDIPYSKRK